MLLPFLTISHWKSEMVWPSTLEVQWEFLTFPSKWSNCPSTPYLLCLHSCQSWKGFAFVLDEQSASNGKLVLSLSLKFPLVAQNLKSNKPPLQLFWTILGFIIIDLRGNQQTKMCLFYQLSIITYTGKLMFNYR